MKKYSLFVLAIMVLGLGCTTDPVQNENLDALQDPEITAEQYLEPMMHYNQEFDFAKFEKEFNTDSELQRTRTRFLFIRVNGYQFPLFPPNECEGAQLQIVLQGQGTSWPMGPFEFNASYCTLDGFNNIGPILGTLTANDGILYTEMLYASDAPNQYGYWEQVWKFYDGTETYEGACGWVKFYITFDFENGTWENRGFGLIRY